MIEHGPAGTHTLLGQERERFGHEVERAEEIVFVGLDVNDARRKLAAAKTLVQQAHGDRVDLAAYAFYKTKGVTPDKDVIAYCRIGERSSHSWFVLHELLGYKRVRNYDGSWTEYGSLIGVPIEKPVPVPA